MIRWSKIILVAAIAFYCLLTVVSNITDYNARFPAVERTLTMKEVFPNTTTTYKAITTPQLHHAVYIFIITLEGLTCLICGVGAWQLVRVRHEKGMIFNRHKKWAIAGLTLGFLTWQSLFMSIGGEWFGMWMSPMLNGALNAAFQIFVTILLVLIYVAAKDD